MLVTNMSVGLLFLIVTVSSQYRYQSSNFQGVPDTDMIVNEEHKISSHVCSISINIPGKSWYWWIGKTAMEVIVFDHEPYAGIDFDTNLETVTVARKPGERGCYGEAKVIVRYSYPYFNGAYKNKNAWNPWNNVGRKVRQAKLPIHTNIPKYESLPSDVKRTVDTRILSHAKIPPLANLRSEVKILEDAAKKSQDGKRPAAEPKYMRYGP